MSYLLKKLSEICNIQNGFAFKSGDYVDFSNTLNFRMSNIRIGGELDLDHNKRYLPDSYVEKYKNFLLEDGDIVIAMTDMATSPKILAIPTLIKTDNRKLLLNQRVGKFTNIDFDSLNISYLRYILLAPDSRETLLSLGGGGVQINISTKQILSLKIPLPPLPTQKAIVQKLDTAFEKIDASIELAQKNLENIEELGKSVLEEVFGDSELQEKSLGDIFDVRDGTHDSPKFHSTGFPLVTSKNLVDGKIDLGNVKLINETDYENINKRSKVDKGDLLFAMIGTIGNPTIVDFEPEFAIKNVALFKSKSSEIIMEYLKYFLLGDTIKKQMLHDSKGATQKFVGLGYLRKFKIPLPPLEKQKEIVEHLDKVFEGNKRLKESYEEKIASLREMKQSLLREAFEGRLVSE